MVGLDLITGLYLLGAAAIGSIFGALVRGRQSNQVLNKVGDDWQSRFDAAVKQNEHLKAEISTMKTSVEAAKQIVQKHIVATNQGKTEIESLREKQNALQKNQPVLLCLSLQSKLPPPPKRYLSATPSPPNSRLPAA